jgi:hypothetical protein
VVEHLPSMQEALSVALGMEKSYMETLKVRIECVYAKTVHCKL